MREKISSLISREIEAIRNIPIEGAVEQAVDLIYEQVHNKGGKVVISGMGKAGQIGVNIATTLSSTGTPAYFLHPSEAQHGDLGIIQKNDIVLAISNSGKTRELIELNYLVHRLYPDIKFIVLTGQNKSELAKNANVVLWTGGPEEICPLGLTPTTSTTVMTVAGDILVVLLMEKIGFTKEEYAKRHHSGYLGQKAKKG
ncbi:MAG: SIS domain-containing protein [Flavobacteriales bacterium]|nr:SIS domain-containing protein [Flavobacteriales bacterium]